MVFFGRPQLCPLVFNQRVKTGDLTKDQLRPFYQRVKTGGLLVNLELGARSLGKKKTCQRLHGVWKTWQRLRKTKSPLEKRAKLGKPTCPSFAGEVAEVYQKKRVTKKAKKEVTKKAKKEVTKKGVKSLNKTLEWIVAPACSLSPNSSYAKVMVGVGSYSSYTKVGSWGYYPR